MLHGQISLVLKNEYIVYWYKTINTLQFIDQNALAFRKLGNVIGIFFLCSLLLKIFCGLYFQE